MHLFRDRVVVQPAQHTRSSRMRRAEGEQRPRRVDFVGARVELQHTSQRTYSNLVSLVLEITFARASPPMSAIWLSASLRRVQVQTSAQGAELPQGLVA